MPRAIALATFARNDAAFRVVFRSIGTASPGDAAAIGLGLGVPVTSVMEALYRAPCVLVEGLTEEIGARMAELLGDLGCEVTLEPADAAPPAPAALFDVALHVTDSLRHGAIISALAGFLGCPAAEAARLVATPPGIVLGKVSQASVDALADRVGPGASLIASDPDAALYDVFLAGCEGVVRSRFEADLRRRGLSPLSAEGWILAGLTRAQADALWAAHRQVQGLRIVNRAFLRFDLVLTGGMPTPPAVRALVEVAGIPDRIVPRLFDELGITVMEAVPNAEMVAALDRLSAAGLEIRADLVTFQHLGIEILQAPRPRAVADVLRRLGIAAAEGDLRRLPFRLPCVLPELQARLLRDALEGTGARAGLLDPAQEGNAR